MNIQPHKVIGSIAIATILSSCGPNVATQCYQVKERLIQYDTFPIQTTKAATLDYAQQRLILAEQLSQLEVTDATLKAHRDQLVSLYQQQNQAILAEAEFMDERGHILLTAAIRERYEQAAQQRRDLARQVQTEQSALQIYCNLQ